MRFSILDFQFSIASAVLAVGMAIANAQTVGFREVKDAPIFCKYLVREEKCPPPLTGFAVPVYAKSPDRDFWLLGELMINGAGIVHDTAEARPWAVQQLATAAKGRGADAIWLVTPFAGRYCQAIVIKWAK